jgi:hypothetical protein
VHAKEFTRDVRAAALPGGRQRAELVVLTRQRILRRRHCRLESATIGVEGTQVKAILTAVPVAHLRRVQRQVRVRVAEHVTCQHVGLDVVDGRAALGQT